jgi:uridine phosphorylase
MNLDKSELILNPGGSIYHLHLLPEQIAPLIILVGDPDRVPMVSQYFDTIECAVQKREFVTHTGRIGPVRLSVLSTGIGTDNIDIVLNEIDALFNIDLTERVPLANLRQLTFIRLGTAGGLQADVPIDGIAVSEAGIGLDGLLHFYQADAQQNHPVLTAMRKQMEGQWNFPLAPYFATGDPALIGLFSPGNAIGYTATNSGFYGPQGRTLRAPVQMPGYLDMLQQFEFKGKKIINLEMETAGIYGLANLLGHRACSISTILANRALGTFSTDPNRAVIRMIEQVLEKITQNGGII